MPGIKTTGFALALATACAFSVIASDAFAQATFADKAVSRLVGSWVSPQGRVISFAIRDGNPIFQDEIEPSVTLTGAYRQDDAGAGYVLRYTYGFECRYNVNVVGSNGSEVNLRLVTSYNAENKRFRCIQGSLRRTTHR
jgi:hypothetical protein